MDALAAADARTAYSLLKSSRLTEELGRARHRPCSSANPMWQGGARDFTPECSRLIHYYRSTEAGLPALGAKDFVTTGYTHYVTLLPSALQRTVASSPEDLTSNAAIYLTRPGEVLPCPLGGRERSAVRLA